MKRYSIELNKKDATLLKGFLKEAKISYESSSCYDNIYFSLNLNTSEVEKVNNFLDTI